MVIEILIESILYNTALNVCKCVCHIQLWKEWRLRI